MPQTPTSQALETEPDVASPDARWPEDYAAIDGGRLRVHPAYVEGFRRAGWRDLAGIMHDDQLDGLVHRQGREMGTAHVRSADESQPVRVHVKRHPGKRPTYCRLGRCEQPQWRSHGVLQADAAAACRRAGVPTMQVVAAGSSCGDEPPDRHAPCDSVFISRFLDRASPADRFWDRRLAAPGRGAQRLQLLEAMARVAAALHRDGLYHRDLYWCHFMVEPRADESFDVRLIDLQRLYAPNAMAAAYGRVKDLAQFWLSKPRGPGGPSAAEMRHWFAAYRGKTSLRPVDRCCLRAIAMRAWLYRVKGVKG